MTDFGIVKKYFCHVNEKEMERIPVKFYRQACIYKTIRQRAYIGLPELIEHVQHILRIDGYDNGVSQRSIQRDIQEMNATWVSILYDKTRKGYYIPTDEMEDAFYEHLFDNIALLSALQSTESVSDYILLEQRPTTGAELLPNMLNALKNKLKIEFDYYKFTEKDFSHRPRTFEAAATRYIQKSDRTNESTLTFKINDYGNRETWNDCNNRRIIEIERIGYYEKH